MEDETARPDSRRRSHCQGDRFGRSTAEVAAPRPQERLRVQRIASTVDTRMVTTSTFCPQCGNSHEFNFCPKCGAPAAHTSAAHHRAATPASPTPWWQDRNSVGNQIASGIGIILAIGMLALIIMVAVNAGVLGA
jgi:hypothetical protein